MLTFGSETLRMQPCLHMLKMQAVQFVVHWEFRLLSVGSEFVSITFVAICAASRPT